MSLLLSVRNAQVDSWTWRWRWADWRAWWLWWACRQRTAPWRATSASDNERHRDYSGTQCCCRCSHQLRLTTNIDCTNSQHGSSATDTTYIDHYQQCIQKVHRFTSQTERPTTDMTITDKLRISCWERNVRRTARRLVRVALWRSSHDTP